jgi:hypothetical protein
MEKKTKKRKICDLPPGANLCGVKFHDPKTGTTGYWFSQWGYENGKAGVWWKEDMRSSSVFPLFLDNLKQALEFYVMD